MRAKLVKLLLHLCEAFIHLFCLLVPCTELRTYRVGLRRVNLVGTDLTGNILRVNAADAITIPFDQVLSTFLNEANPFEDICDVVDASFLNFEASYSAI